jgi:hypothetical protein
MGDIETGLAMSVIKWGLDITQNSILRWNLTAGSPVGGRVI